MGTDRPIGTQPVQPRSHGNDPWIPWGRPRSASPTLSDAGSDVSEPNCDTKPERWEPFKPWTMRPGSWSSAISKPPGVAPPFQNPGGQVYRVVATPVAVPPPQVAASQSAIL